MRVLAVALLLACGPARPLAIEKPAPKPKPVIALPGACVDPVNDALDRLGPDADREGIRVERTLDLDADGHVDPFVTESAFCGTGGCTWHVYVSRGACAHYVGEMFGVLPVAGLEAHGGLIDLEIGAKTGCGGMARTETRARFDGKFYVPYSMRKCRCPDEGDDAKVPDPEALCEPWKAVSAPAE